MVRFNLAALLVLTQFLVVPRGAAAADDPVPTAHEIAVLGRLPEGYIVYATGEKSGDDGKAYGIFKMDMQETTPVQIAERGRAPMIHPSDPNKIVYSEPIAPGSDQYHIVVMDFDGKNRQVMTKETMPNLMFVSWTDRGEFVFTSSDVLPVYNDPLKMYHMDLEGNVTQIPTDFPTEDKQGGGVDGVFMFKNRVLLRHDYHVGLYSVDQDNLAAGIELIKEAPGGSNCGVTVHPDWNGCLYNGLFHKEFIERKVDEEFTEIRRHDAPRGWANDFAFSNEYEWGLFTLEKTDDCSEDIYVYNVETREVIRHSWLPCETYPHNPDMWCGPYELNRVSKPRIDATPYMIEDSVVVPISCRTEGATIHYTLDGSEPTTASPVYTEPLVVKEDSTTLTARGFKEGLDPSRISSITFSSGMLIEPENPSNTLPGISYAYYEGCDDDGGFDTLTPTSTGVLDSITLEIPDRAGDNFIVVFTGYLSIPESGMYYFSTTSDDGARLFIGDTLLIDDWGGHAAKTESGKLLLRSGLHAIRVEYIERGGNQVCEVTYAGGDMLKQPLPASACFHADPTAEPSIVLLTPVQGHEATLGAQLKVSWNYTEGSDVVVEFSPEDGKPNTWEELAQIKSTAGTTEYPWSVPNDPAYETTTGRFRLFDYNKHQIETVSPAFTITSNSAAVRPGGNRLEGRQIVLANGRLRFTPLSPRDHEPRVLITTAHGRRIHVPANRESGKAVYWDLSALESGVFFITIEGRAVSRTRTFTVVR